MTYNPKLCKINFLAIVILAIQVSIGGLLNAQTTKKADKYFLKQQYPKALQLYVKCLENTKITPEKTLDIYYKMAQCYMAMDYYPMAYRYIKQVVRQNPSFLQAYPVYFYASTNVGDYKTAIGVFDKCISDSNFNKDSNFVKIMFPYEYNVSNTFVELMEQYAINTFGKKRALTFFDDKLFYSTTGYLIDPLEKDYTSKIVDYTVFESKYEGPEIINSVVMEKIPVLQKNSIFAIAMQSPDTLYFVTVNSKGEKVLRFSVRDKDSLFTSDKAVKIAGKFLPIENLIFVNRGKRMIFSAELKDGFGGKDLWYTDLQNGVWQKPINMGAKINTPNDEITPYVYGSYLFFSSNGQLENYGGFDIYGTSLSDTSAKVENLKQPYNSSADDFAFVVNPNFDGGFFVSNRDTSTLDDKIYGFSEIPNFTMYHGVVLDKNEKQIPSVKFTITEKNTGKIANIVKSNNEGVYNFFLNSNNTYIIEIEKDNYFRKKLTYPSTNDTIISNRIKYENIILDGFTLNEAYKLQDVFHQTADVEVLENQQLNTLLDFLKNNPNLDVYIHLFSYLSNNEEFNSVIGKKRIANLGEYLQKRGITKNRIHCKNYSSQKPTNYPLIDLTKDKTYALYFVFTIKDEETYLPQTEDLKRY